MTGLFHAGRYLLADMASTFFFLGLLAITHDVTLAVALGMTLGVLQIVWQKLRAKPIDAMQWLSLFLVVAGGAATLLTHDPRFVMAKASVIYVVVGSVMLKPGWMNRYLPPVAKQVAPDVAYAFGFIWAGLMFASAGINLALAMTLKPLDWAAAMSVWATGSKLGLFAIQYLTMRTVGAGRVRRGEVVLAAA
ncbi:MAG TPA: septation protein IspZ [Caulobacteraceae bacterium]|jgi:intracellular septation protein A|nr:septation protein IspZ [Caulobacteraceae bacterium]